MDCKGIKLKEISPEHSLEGLMMRLKLQYSGHLMQRLYSLEKTLILGKIKGRRRRGRQRMRWLDGITDSTDMSLSKLQQMVKHRVAWCAEVHRVAKRWTRLNNNKKHSGGARSQDFQGVRLEEVWSTPSLLQLHI